MNSHKEIVLDGELSLNIPMDGEVGIVYGENEIVFYQASGGWIAYFTTKASGNAAIKIEKAVTS